jgi:hypothetical protein
MISKFINSNDSKNIESVIAWGSVAYVAGFFIVMVHTASLGIPIIEILKPIYIWIGLPLALVIFSIRWLWKLTIERVNRAKVQFEKIKSETKDVLFSKKKRKVEDLVEIYISSWYAMLLLLPAVLEYPLYKLIKYAENTIRKSIKWAIEIDLHNIRKKRKITQSKYLETNFKWLKGAEIFVRALGEAIRFFKFSILLLAIPVISLFYVYKIYPAIPQSYGGGKPMTAVLIINSDDLPVNSPDICSLFTDNTCLSQPEKVFTTTEIEILYTTSEEYYLRASNQKIFSIKRDIVSGIIYDKVP